MHQRPHSQYTPAIAFVLPKSHPLHLIFIPFNSTYLSLLRMAPIYSTQRRNRQRSMSCTSTRYTASSYLPLQLPMARSTALLHQEATRFRSHTNQTRSIVTASSFPRDETAGEKLRSYDVALMRKHGARRGSTTSSLVLTVEGSEAGSR